ncbi:hypothetical protein Tco_0721499 [Tanacetum coccineum]
MVPRKGKNPEQRKERKDTTVGKLSYDMLQRNLGTPAKLTQAKLNQCSRDAGLPKDKLGLELPLLGDEGLSFKGNKLNSIFITVENDVERLYARLICLREMREEVLVRSGLNSVCFNKECDQVFRRINDNSEMIIYDFMTFPSWGDAKVVKESHHLSSSLLERVSSHTTAPAVEGAMILLPTLDEIVASLPDPHLAKKSKGLSQVRLRKRASEPGSSAPELGQAKGMDEADLTDFCAEIENSFERDGGTSARAASALTPRLGKRLGAPPFVADVSASGPSHVGTSVHVSTSRCNLSLGGAVVSGHAEKFGAEVLRRQVDLLDFFARSALAHDVEYDQIPEDDFSTTTRGEDVVVVS